MTRTVFAAALLASAIAASVAAEPPVPASPPPILFAADNEPALSGDIFRLDANGRRVNLSKSPFADEDPLVSPDGRWVAFVSERGGGPGIYEVGIDGARLRRLDPPPHQIGVTRNGPQLAWSPDADVLASVTGDVKAALWILTPGRRPTLIERGSFLSAPSWSPDGKLLTTVDGRAARAYTEAGTFAWKVPSPGSAAWSSRGLFTTIGKGSIKVYDEHGRFRFSARGCTAAWSPDGSRLASIAGGTLAVRTADGRVFLRKQIRASEFVGLAWMDNRRVLVGRYPHVVGVDTATGKLFAGSGRYFDGSARSADNRLLAETRRQGSRFEPGLTKLQFVPGRRSLVYQSDCAEPTAALYAINPDGAGLRRVTHGQTSETQPAWSPDGARIAYARYEPDDDICLGCPEAIAVADADGSHPRVLAKRGGDTMAVNRPTWSPDGTKILVSLWSYRTRASSMSSRPPADRRRACTSSPTRPRGARPESRTSTTRRSRRRCGRRCRTEATGRRSPSARWTRRSATRPGRATGA